jgi:signal transduction histidine kinase
VTILVEDDGRGFGTRGGDDDGLGLVGMRERVGLLGGRLAIESTEGSGTTIVAEVPLR